MRRLPTTGATLVEVLVAIALTGVLLPALATSLLISQRAHPASLQQLEAEGLVHEADEAVRNVREQGWNSFAVDGTYHPAISGATWSLQTGSEVVSGFTRQVVISSVERNSSGVIVGSGGTLDPSTKHIVVTVAWSSPYSESVSSDSYLTRWQHNSTWTQTTVANFSAGTLTQTVTTNTAGGEVQLAPSGSNYQSNGTFESSSFDAGSTVGFQSLLFTDSNSGGSSLQFQVASNTDNATWNYVGPDGTAGSYFAAGGPIPLSAATGRYFRYKAYFTAGSSNTTTSILNDVTVNYSL